MPESEITRLKGFGCTTYREQIIQFENEINEKRTAEELGAPPSTINGWLRRRGTTHTRNQNNGGKEGEGVPSLIDFKRGSQRSRSECKGKKQRLRWNSFLVVADKNESVGRVGRCCIRTASWKHAVGYTRLPVDGRSVLHKNGKLETRRGKHAVARGFLQER